jgi:Ca2+-binding EF-hand superfamily protein
MIDLLFRRLDVDKDAELSFDEFYQAFGDPTPGITLSEDLVIVREALVQVLDRLEERNLTLIQAWQAFDRDASGNISIAEFSTLVRFLTTNQNHHYHHHHDQEGGRLVHLSKHQIYLMMQCLDTSADRRINQQEFLKFFFIMWSHRLMQVQDLLFEYENPYEHQETTSQQQDHFIALKKKRKELRKALRKNFSRPFRDSMRCLEIENGLPGPFTGLLNQFKLHSTMTTKTTSGTSKYNNLPDDHDQDYTHDTMSIPMIEEMDTETDTVNKSKTQVWQVLKGHASSNATKQRKTIEQQAVDGILGASNLDATTASWRLGIQQTKQKKIQESRKRVEKGKNEVFRTKITRQQAPKRSNAILTTAPNQVSLDGTAKLKYDFMKQLY